MNPRNNDPRSGPTIATLTNSVSVINPIRTFITVSKSRYRPAATSARAANEWRIPQLRMLITGHSACAATPQALIKPPATIKLHSTR